MKAGNFNINDYLEKLYEESTPMMDGGEGLVNAEGIIIPQENKKSYDWLKKEFQAGKTEVKVEINMGNSNFTPGYDMQTKLDSVKDFKPGMFGDVKTSNSKDDSQKDDSQKEDSMDANKDKKQFQKKETDSTKKDINDKTSDKKNNINNKEEKDSKETDTKEKEDKPKESKEKPEVKKIDLKTKKK